jgi:uncharacterized protein YbaP (TraB family)
MIGILTVLIGFSCQPAASLAQQTDALPDDNHLLWEISGKGLKKPAYLYGTIHILKKEDFVVKPIVEEKLKQADRLILEVPLDGAAMLSSVLTMMMPPPMSLQKLLSPEDYSLLKDFVDTHTGLPMMMFDKIKPVFTTQQLMASYCLGDEPASYEMYFTDLFKQMGKPVSGLETVREQMDFMEVLSIEEQTEGLMRVVNSPDSICMEFQKMADFYKAEQLDSMMVMAGEDVEIGDHMDDLVHQRNRNWIPRMEKRFEEKKERLFFAVGAGHLPGEEGVVSLLRKEGYTVIPVLP